MKSCVLDIGSNTIRAVVFDIIGERINTIYNKALKSILFDYTVDEKLTSAGIEVLSAAIAELCAMTAELECDYHAFATSAFRDLKNQQEVIDYIYRTNGIRIRVLSGEEEAECDYMGMRHETGAVRGIGADLGGGSCQLLSFSEEGLTAALSVPLGTARLRRKFVSGGLPNEEEGKRIYDFVTREISSHTIFKKDKSAMFAFGGSARAALMIKHVIHANRRADRITVEELNSFLEFARTPGAETFIKGVVRKRYDTVVVGIIIMKAIADYVGIDYIKVLDCGVREGYVRKYIM